MHPTASESRPFCPLCDQDNLEIIQECLVKDVAGNVCHLAKCFCRSCGRIFTVMI